MAKKSKDAVAKNDPGQPAPTPIAPTDFEPRAKLPFVVVGIGASAGGLSALGEFFDNMPPDCGMAFVIIQHLSPEHPSLLSELLSRRTGMPVLTIEDQQAVMPGHVYVIRPAVTVTLKDGKLHLGEPVEARGHRRPVDDFFRSLAAEQVEKSIAIVMSGTGTNGTAGAQAIKAAGGFCIAQDPESAEFAGMPLSLIHAGYADQILIPRDMPAMLRQYVQHPYLQSDAEASAWTGEQLEQERQQYNAILAILRTRTGHQFAGYKKPTVLRRIQRRMGLVGTTKLRDYVALLRDRPEEALALANDLMINVTGFFRDPEAWEALRTAVVRPLIEAPPADGPLRAWVAACASGEEAYSLAMLLAEECDRAHRPLEAKIFATDLADKSLALARAGVYAGGIEGDVSPERLARFFEKDEHTYRIKKEIRDVVVFEPQDVLRDPPFSRVDICTCRNLLIYLEPETQRRVLSLMHFALRDGGFLFLGNAETPSVSEPLFETVSKKWRIYRRVGGGHHRFGQLPMLATGGLHQRIAPDAAPVPAPAPAPQWVQWALLDRFGPPSVVIDSRDQVIYFHGETGPFLKQPSGEPTRNLFDLVRLPLRAAARSAISRAAVEGHAVNVADVQTEEGGPWRRVVVRAEPLMPERGAHYVLVSFELKNEEATAEAQAAEAGNGQEGAAVASERWSAEAGVKLEDELRILRRELQNTVEMFEASNEELKAANEEATSVNEELQSANEELETGKEELQSLNEELITVNNQLQSKITELEAANNDLSNLLSSTDIAVVFLDSNLCVRRFTPAMSDLLELIASDVGRPLSHLAPKFDDRALLADARAVLEKLVPLEAEVTSHSGRWYLRRVLPYRTGDNRIDGIVITFVDISERQRARQAAVAAQMRLQAAVEQMPTAVVLVEVPSGRLLLANQRAARLFGHHYPIGGNGIEWSALYGGLKLYRIDGSVLPLKDWPLARTLRDGATIVDEEVGYMRIDGSRGVLAVSSAPINDSSGTTVAAVAALWDISERKQAEWLLRDSEERFRLMVESAQDYAIFTLDDMGRVATWNSGAERLIGWTATEIIGQSSSMLFTPEDRAAKAPEKELQTARETGSASDERIHLRKNGSRFWASGILNVMVDPSGAVRGYVKILRDQTERKQNDERLREALQSAESMREVAENANRAKDHFIATVSHELRTPLNTIRLWSRMLGSKKVSDADRTSGIQVIDRAAQAQQQLIDDLLDVSRMASGKLRLSLREVQFEQVVQAALAAVDHTAVARGIRMVTELQPVGTITVDPDRIQQVVWNLISNAVKFTPFGGQVTVALRRNADQIELQIVDTGIGIRPEFLPHVFERFQQAEVATTRQHRGLGLGLAIARQLVELHGGTIEAHSNGLGHGATFRVRLPVVPSVAGPASDETADSRAHDAALQGLDILLVEDEAPARDALAKLLTERGASIRSVDSAEAALQAHALRPPDVILSDIGMPGEDGYSLARRLRSREVQRGTPHVLAVALTAFARQEDQQRALEAGFDAHVAKPIDTDALVSLITQFTRKV